ncbi:MAG: sporulation transcriptional regulator SpoIIID, partial [Oscillospiraceae bacterium]|nr:sporulation transcriptional regulator SpoIIID [Oscillospiraceae bacterium]
MKNTPNDRAVVLGEYILENGATVRATAKEFGISKSTVHTVVT